MAPRDVSTVDVGAMQTGGTYVSTLVEITGGGGIVEQRADDPAGTGGRPVLERRRPVEWWFADGYTKDASKEDIVITNPFPDVAIVNFELATAEGNRQPSTLQGYPVPGRSVSVVHLDSVVRDDDSVAVGVTSTRGRVVVGRAQRYAGADRAGFTMNLGAPSLTDQAFFADGESGEGINERYSVFNGSDQDITVQAVFLGVPIDASFPNDEQLTVPAGSVVTLDTADVAGLPAGRHGVVFSTTSPDSMAVERAMTRPAGDGIATTVVLGQPSRAAQDRRWSMAIGTDLAVPDTLVVLNIDNQDALVTVSALGPGGEVPVSGMENITVGKNAVVALSVTDQTALEPPAGGGELVAHLRRAAAAAQPGPARPVRIVRPARLMIQLLVAAGVVAIAVVVGLVLRRRHHVDVPTQVSYEAPTQLDRTDFPDATAPWLVAVFSSATCTTCADVIRKAGVLRTEAVDVVDVEYDGRQGAARQVPHRRRADRRHRRPGRRGAQALHRPRHGHRPVGRLRGSSNGRLTSCHGVCPSEQIECTSVRSPNARRSRTCD